MDVQQATQKDVKRRSTKSLDLVSFRRDIWHLILLFLVWKWFLLLIACLSPGDGYDTSTQLLFDQYDCDHSRAWPGRFVEHVALKLTRWDGIYFATLSERQHLNEQEWAFSWFLTDIVTYPISKVLLSPVTLSPIIKAAITGIIISHLSHLLAVLVLYWLTYELIPSKTEFTKRRIAFTASCLHIISPAGLFLSAPYGESTFAFLSFTGILVYVLAIKGRYDNSPKSTYLEIFWKLQSGVWFGMAAMIRSNGLLNGMLFTSDVIEAFLRPTRLLDLRTQMLRLATAIVSGSFVGIGFAVPQIAAYTEYCMGGNTRPWCSRMPPSIYNWVQEHYWEVGFMKYWTLNNLPLFLLAGPMIVVLILSGAMALWQVEQVAAMCIDADASAEKTDNDKAMNVKRAVFIHAFTRIAVPQIVLAVMAATSFHVQIVNRISSGYPVWYILLAIGIHVSSRPNAKNAGSGSVVRWTLSKSLVKWLVRVVVMYAVIQGGLFACFLPPA